MSPTQPSPDLSPSDLNLTAHHIPTTHGTIHVLDTGPPPQKPPTTLPTLLLLHGNTSSSRIFLPLLRAASTSPALRAHRTLLLDLPGHGQSTDAPDPDASYTQPAYADAAIQVLDALLGGGGEREAGVVVLGWSLGGHNAIEMVAQLEQENESDGQKRGRVRVRGIMLTGTPPALGEEQVRRGFTLRERKQEGGTGKKKEQLEEADDEQQNINLAATEHWQPHHFDSFPFAAVRGARAPWIRDAAIRTDGRARRIMFDAFEDARGVDQVRVVGESDVPCAVVNGGDEPFVNLDYLDALRYRNLWEGKCYRLPGLGHAPFWEEPETFLAYWERFVKHCLGEAA